MSRNIILRSIFFTVLVMCFSSCKVGRFAYYNFANITDHEIFPARTAVNDSAKFTFAVASTPKSPKEVTFDGKKISFDDFLAKNKTVAFLIIKNDSIQYENYFNGYGRESVVASFSMAKSVTSVLIGCAIEDGFIKSVDEPALNYIPEWKGRGLDSITIRHLLQMTSGLRFNESYINPFGDAATFYYGRDLKKSIFKRKPEHKPGTVYSYSSGDTQILGLILERALKGKAITAYLQEKVWRPLGMEYDATWSLDKENGLEKTFCCINARARDFAKIGRLYLNGGNWNGRQIVSKDWVKQSVAPEDGDKNVVRYYQYQWWLHSDGSYLAKGILGQFVYVNPSKNLIIVRLGEDYGKAGWEGIFTSLAEGY